MIESVLWQQKEHINQKQKNTVEFTDFLKEWQVLLVETCLKEGEQWEERRLARKLAFSK